MRTPFIVMLLASVALHLALTGWFLFPHARTSDDVIVREVIPPETIILLPPPLPVALPPPAAMLDHPTSMPVVVKAAPVIAPPETVRVIEKAAPAEVVAMKPSAAPEVNPNVNAKPLERDAVLSPVPPPILDSGSGVVFLLDVSGSMYEPFNGTTRLQLAREELTGRLHSLPNGMPFAVVLYAQGSLPSGPLVAANNATREAAVRFISQDADCGGGTNLPAGLEAAARLKSGRIVLVSDGDLNATEHVLEMKVRDILGQTARAPDLDVVAIAPRVNVGADRLLEDLAETEGGSFCVPKMDLPRATPAPTTSKPARR